MTWALSNAAADAQFPPAPGIVPRTAGLVMASMAKISQGDGSFRYGLSAAKVAALCKFSLRVVRRYQSYLVGLGILEKVEVGGGHKATKWRINVARLLSFVADTARPARRDDTPDATPRHGSDARPRLFRRLSRRALPELGSRLQGESSPAVMAVCEEHGGDAGIMASGEPRCPSCRLRRRENSRI